MELISYQQMIVQGMANLNTLTNLDCLWLSPEFDSVHGFINNPLPSVLNFQKTSSYEEILSKCTSEDKPLFCHAATASDLEFIFIPLNFESNFLGFVRIGPFLTNLMDNQYLSDLLFVLSIPLKDHMGLRHFYNSLRIIANREELILGHVGMNLFGYNLPIAKHCLFSENLLNAPKSAVTPEPINSIDELELRYAMEHKLIQAIATTDRQLLKEAMAYFTDQSFLKDRNPNNPLRSAKNLTIVLNTILRHAAEQGGLHPYYLHQISTKYAILLEQANTRVDIYKLQNEMYESYFEEVLEHTYNSRSPFIKKVINYIQLHLDSQLSTTLIAENFDMKPSNLSNQFKKEMGLTISEFVNSLRIKKACHYLRNSTVNIGDIGTMVGYIDINYFSRTFKKLKGMSPSAYRNNG